VCAPFSPRSVLVIEDNPDNRETLRVLLELWGHPVDVAPDGQQGVEKALDWRPEAAVVDIGLPRLDGYQVARRLREYLGCGVLLVALTAYSGEEDVRKAREAGFNHFTTKPADLDKLQRLLGR
jgi:CheY-like chemotaxis protein